MGVVFSVNCNRGSVKKSNIWWALKLGRACKEEKVHICPMRRGCLNNPYFGAIFIGTKRKERWEFGKPTVPLKKLPKCRFRVRLLKKIAFIPLKNLGFADNSSFCVALTSTALLFLDHVIYRTRLCFSVKYHLLWEAKSETSKDKVVENLKPKRITQIWVINNT